MAAGPASTDFRASLGDSSRLIGIYRAIRHFYNIPEPVASPFSPFYRFYAYAYTLNRHLNFVSFIVGPFILLFRGRCSLAGIRVPARYILDFTKGGNIRLSRTLDLNEFYIYIFPKARTQDFNNSIRYIFKEIIFRKHKLVELIDFVREYRLVE